jgi:hypothetical protein
MNDYILFVGQQAIFQSRTMLIPAKEFLEVRNDDYQLLKQHSVKNSHFPSSNTTIENILIINYIFKGNCGSQEDTPYNQICNQLTHYADGMEEDCYFDMKDKLWYDAAKTNLCGGFNHVKNYKYCKEYAQNNNLNVIDGFLVLKSDDGVLNKQMFDTVEELMQFYITK